MENDAARLQCPNENCQAPNPLTHKFCQQCRTPLPKRYLWAVGDGLSVGDAGEILADRYLVISDFVLFDTKPGLLPQIPEVENFQKLTAYLRLIPYRLHIPQVYGVMSCKDGNPSKEILLLEKPALLVDEASDRVELLPELSSAWSSATSMRQVNWLWQIAQLWQPMASEGVASSLLDPHLLRVEGGLVRLLELSLDVQQRPSLAELGEFWRVQFCPGAKSAIAEFLNQVCTSLTQQEINSSEQLIEVLDKGLVQVGKSQTVTFTIVTKTDTGPSRQRNEDACYPPSGSKIIKPPSPTALAIVCDGIGGHEGGNVASNLAIETIQQRLQQLTQLDPDHIVPSNLLTDLEVAAAAANDKISQRNDSENRSGRQRMGTTLVMGLPVGHEIYIAHVGDSRAYWITGNGCYQVTLDDDVASREVRLGYAVYRDAVQQGASGSLVQALGMSPSISLHPTAQRFILDEDSVFLLCSDGLSDFDRVEQYWETEILPILTENANVVDVVDKLLEIANKQNGHDNVTIALIHSQVKYSEPNSSVKAVIPDFSAAVPNYSATVLQPAAPSSNSRTQVLSDTKPAKKAKLPLQLLVPLFLAVAAGGLAYWFTQMKPRLAVTTRQTPIPSTQTPGRQLLLSDLRTGFQVSSNKEISLSRATSGLKEVIIAPANSVLQVIKTGPPILKDEWLLLRSCGIKPETVTPATPGKENTKQTIKKPANTQNQLGFQEEGWVKRSELAAIKPPVTVSIPGDVSNCQKSGETPPPGFPLPSPNVPPSPSGVPGT